MNLSVIAGKLAGIISLCAFLPYIIAILRKQTKPNRASWWIWSAVGLMLGASYFSSGARNTIWVPVSYIIGPLTIAFLSIPYGEGGWNRFDRYCLIISALSIVLWISFKNPLIALLINLSMDTLGGLPTMRKSYKNPEGEDKLAWTLFSTGNLVNIFAIETIKFSIMIYPIWMFICPCGIITLLVLWPRNKAAEA
ncbi:MAG: hypothetical protein WC460_03365 [Patescibacteria group bacterium]